MKHQALAALLGCAVGMAVVSALLGGCGVDPNGLDGPAQPWLELEGDDPGRGPCMAGRDPAPVPCLPGAPVTHTAFWAQVPIDVWVRDPEADLVASAAVAWWNAQAGRPLFNPPAPALPATIAIFADREKRPLLERAVLVVVHGDDAGHGESDFRYDRRTGRLINVVVSVPAKPLRIEVVHHELGHALGLAHCPIEGTLMHQGLPPVGEVPLADYQLRAVRSIR